MSAEPPVRPREHLSLDVLAELDEGLLDRRAGNRARAHLTECARCRERLESLGEVRRSLAAVVAAPIPADVTGRIEAALARAAATRGPAATTPTDGAAAGTAAAAASPPARTGAGRLSASLEAPHLRRRPRPNGAAVLAIGAAACIVLLLVGALLLGNLRSTSSYGRSASTADRLSSGAGSHPTTVTGRNYTAATLPALVQSLLSSTSSITEYATGAKGAAASPSATAVPEALSTLAAPGPLASCVTELAGKAGVRPLAVDFAQYDGQPAAVVVLPEFGGRPPLLDVWVVAPTCRKGDPHLLYFVRLPQPPGIRAP